MIVRHRLQAAGEAIILIGLGGIGLADAWRVLNFVAKTGIYEGGKGSAAYEAGVCGLLLVVGLAWLVSTLLRVQRAAPSESHRTEGSNDGRSMKARPDIKMLGLMAAYSFLCPYVGYWAASTIFFCAALYVLTPNRRAGFLLGLFLAFGFYLVFGRLASIPFPRGVVPW